MIFKLFGIIVLQTILSSEGVEAILNYDEGPIPRIASGKPVRQGSFPYTVNIWQEVEGVTFGIISGCGGSLLTPRHVLTSANCMLYMVPSLTQVLVRAGSISKTAGGQVANVTRIINHPKYNASNNANDISILELSTPIKDAKVVRLPKTQPRVGSQCTVSGWGMNQGEAEDLLNGGDKLRSADMPIVKRQICDTEQFPTTPNQMCVGTSDDNAVLISVSEGMGDPLVLKRTNIQVGVAGFTPSDDPLADEHGHPNIFTSVAPYVSWIRKETGKTD